MKKIYDLGIRIYENAVAAFFVVIEVFVVLQVVARYVFRISIPWTEDMARHLLVLVAFAGGVIVSRKGEHLGAYFLRDMAPGRAKAALFIVNSAICAVYFAVTAYGAWVMYGKMSPILTTATVDWVQIRWLYLFLLIGGVGMAAYSLRDFALAVHAFRHRIAITRGGRSSPFPEKG
ncbi:MAG: TRAP transporter small permease [Planctomycetes bacterium]|nr:TRAP transporter small permease [Planctomycetota bacterium]